MRILCIAFILAFAPTACKTSGKSSAAKNIIDDPMCDPLFDRVCLPKESKKSGYRASSSGSTPW